MPKSPDIRALFQRAGPLFELETWAVFGCGAFALALICFGRSLALLVVALFPAARPAKLKQLAVVCAGTDWWGNHVASPTDVDV